MKISVIHSYNLTYTVITCLTVTLNICGIAAWRWLRETQSKPVVASLS